MPAGRPTKYDPKFCQMLIDHCAEGLSIEAFCAVAKVSKQTLYDWFDAHPEFLDAKRLAVQESQMFWEKKGLEGLFSETKTEGEGQKKRTTSKSLNSSVWIFNMKNRFKWRDRIETIDSPDNKPKRLIVEVDDGDDKAS